ADVGNRQAFGLHFLDLLQRADDARLDRLDAVAGHFQHRQSVQRDVGARPGVRSRRQVVGVGFAGDLENGQADLFGYCGLGGEPLAGGPGLQHGFGVLIALLGPFGHVVEGIKHQQGVFELFGGGGGQFFVIQQFHQGGDVVATLHGAEQFNGAYLVQQRRGGFTLGYRRQEGGFDVGSFIHTRRNAVGEQIKQEFFFARRRVLQQFYQTSGLFGIERLRYNTLGGAFFNVFAIGFKHNYYPHQSVPLVTERSSSRTQDAGNRDGCKRRPDLVLATRLTGVSESRLRADACTQHLRPPRILQYREGKVKREPAAAQRVRRGYFSTRSWRWSIMSSGLSTRTSPLS